ncbi:hypothetical protein [Paraburkholderia sp. GAS348]|uniref:hypothetical protein n=1 Tax=Paraburkholderia sp. GAS348 TaxID=3035132 RepID=UPI003D26151E
MPTSLSQPSFKRIAEQLPAMPTEARLPFIQAQLSAIEDPEQRELVEAALLVGMQLGFQRPPSSVVVLVHGIRTYAEWQERLADTLTAGGCDKVYPIGYGFFDVLSFLCPFFTRRRPIERVLRELRTIRSIHNDAEISVVAHSFGTYVLSKILDDATDLRFHRVVLCGSIVPLRYRWDKVVARVTGNIVNDAGTRDYWPVAASKATWGYGPSGTFGFKTAVIKDRFHNCGHSDFFADDLMQQYWVPFLLNGQLVPSTWARSRPRANAVLSFVSWFPIKSVIAIAVIVRTTFVLTGHVL